MNPDTGQYEREALIREFAENNNLTEAEAAGKLLGTRHPVRVEATEAEMASMAAAVREQFKAFQEKKDGRFKS